LPSRRYQLPIDPSGAARCNCPPLNAEKALAEDALADKGRAAALRAGAQGRRR
jgi:hypothetical protein